MLKNLVKDLKPSSTLAINETSKQLEEQGKKIFKLSSEVTWKIKFFRDKNFFVDIDREITINSYNQLYLLIFDFFLF